MSKTIPLTQGKLAIVDNEDFERIDRHKWCAHKIGKSWYATRHTSRKLGKPKLIFMHRQIMNALPNMQIDHIHRNGLDNRKSNLRICTQQQNLRNRRKAIGKTSKYIGVSWDKITKKWVVRIGHNKKSFNLGRFNNEESAAKVYDKKAKELFGEFANTNF